MFDLGQNSRPVSRSVSESHAWSSLPVVAPTLNVHLSCVCKQSYLPNEVKTSYSGIQLLSLNLLFLQRLRAPRTAWNDVGFFGACHEPCCLKTALGLLFHQPSMDNRVTSPPRNAQQLFPFNMCAKEFSSKITFCHPNFRLSSSLQNTNTIILYTNGSTIF